MTFSPGTRLGPYEILAPLGAGGMGEVYRGRDPRIGRDVAIKVLPAMWSHDGDRLRRFEQEARAAGALNHPALLTIYDVGDQDGAPYLVSELLEGETLRTRLRAGALPPRRAIEFGIQIARALAVAHAEGIVHRDIKPENIFITRDGRVKILDFGLAKLRLRNERGSQGATLAHHTEPGAVMGTVGYMSPEQVRGETVDERSDIFSLGAVLYEALAGRAPFERDSSAETMAAILKEEPPEISVTNSQINPAVAKVVRRCLEKHKDARYQSAADLAFHLEDLSDWSGSGPTTLRRIWKRGASLAAASVILVILLLGGLIAYRWSAAPTYFHWGVHEMSTLAIAPPQGWMFNEPFTGPFAVSPDGRQIVFGGLTEDGKRKLWLRMLIDGRMTPIDGTDDGQAPFWSPDGQAIAFFTPDAMKIVRLSGGTPITLFTQQLVGVLGGAWSRGGKIVVAMGGIFTVPPGGGKPHTVIPFVRDVSYNNPTFIDEEHIAVTRVATGVDPELLVVSLRDGTGRSLRKNAAAPAYTSRGILLFISAETLLAQKFDERRLEFDDEPATVAKPVAWDGGNAAGSYSVARDGDVLLYQPTASFESEIVIVDSAGHRLKTVHTSALTGDLNVSHDGTRAAFSVGNGNGTGDIWIADLQQQILTRLTRSNAANSAPVFSPDDRRIAFSDGHDIVEIAADGGQRNVLLKTQWFVYPSDWSGDGQSILYTDLQPSAISIYALRPSDRKVTPVVRTRYMDVGGHLSPDGKWIAYASYESGTFEVYVQRFPEGGSKTRISSSGASSPQWSRDGHCVYYVANGKLTSSDIVLGPTVRVTGSRPWFDLQALNPFGGMHVPLADGTFLVNAVTETSQRHLATVVLNWSERLRKSNYR